MTSWARLTHITRLERSVPIPDDHWTQVDIWVPALAFCGEGFTPFFLANGNIMDAMGWDDDFGWDTLENSSNSDPLTAGTTFTVGYHRTPVTGGYSFDWYVNGNHIINNPGPFTSVGFLPLITLNANPQFCCCMNVYYTNFMVGTSQGADDVFFDDFSGGFGNWTVTPFISGTPSFASVVSAPSSAPCPTVTLNKEGAQVGDTVIATGSGFAPLSTVTVYAVGSASGSFPVDVTITTDAVGNFTASFKMPYGMGVSTPPNPSTLYFEDASQLMACASVFVCGGKRADGIAAGVNAENVNTDLPNPLVAFGGQTSDGSENAVLDYIWHDGAHWVLWADGSAIDNAGTFNPIPANHTMTATQITPDGTVTDYPINTGYRLDVAKPPNALNFDSQSNQFCPSQNIIIPIWNQSWWFQNWSKPIYDAKFASDGTTLWVGVLTRETVNYPWGGNFDVDAAQAGDPESFSWPITRNNAAGGVQSPLIRFSIGIPDDFCYRTAFPVSDLGDGGSGTWDPFRIRMFAFDGSTFNSLGTMDAQYCPGTRDNPNSVCYETDSDIQHGAFCSGFSLAASEAEPGICHLVWSEGGNNGQSGLAGDDPSGCPCPLIWDGGPPNRNYRVGYSTWTPTAKASEVNLWESSFFRGYSLYEDAVGPQLWFTYDGDRAEITWPASGEDLAATTQFVVRNDSGRPLLFLSWLLAIQDYGEFGPDGDGNPYLDRIIVGAEPTLRVYDITGGSPVQLTQIDASLLPNEAETENAFSILDNPPPIAPNTLSVGGAYGATAITPNPAPNFDDDNPPARATFGVSDIYNDPLTGGTPVYLLHVPWAHAPIGGSPTPGYAMMRGFYRIPVDMSATFGFLDGIRQYGFTIVPAAGEQFDPLLERFANARFFSDPDNIWFPAPGLGASLGDGVLGVWFDRICDGFWEDIRNAETPGDFHDITDIEVGRAACPGFHYDAEADSISLAATLPGVTPPSDLFAVITLFICRGCRNCQCGGGVHIAHRI